MTVKATFLFNGQAADGQRMFGFSESWYYGGSPDAAILAMDTVMIQRRKLLAYGVACVGYRLSTVGGLSYVVRKSIIGPGSNDYPNLPVDAALCKVNIDQAQAQKQFWLHALPDDWIVKGQILDDKKPLIRNAVDSYCALNFQARYQNQAAATAKIMSVSDAGLVTTQQNHGMVAGQTVKFLRVRDIHGKPVKGTFLIQSAPTLTTLQIVSWTGQTVANTGKIRATAYLYGTALSLLNLGVVGAGTRKVGRPFFQPRGRAVKR